MICDSCDRKDNDCFENSYKAFERIYNQSGGKIRCTSYLKKENDFISNLMSSAKKILYECAEEVLRDLLKENATLKQFKNQIVFCDDCKFSRVNMGKGCGYFCGHPEHIINMECHATDFCSFGERKKKDER